MADADESFRFLSAHEFRKLSPRERSDYLMRAVQQLIQRVKKKAAGEPPKKKR